MNFVIVCPDKYCRGVTIVNKKHDTIQCRSCNSQYKFSRYKMAYKSENKDDAIKARTKLLTKINDSNKSFEEIKKEGYFDNIERSFSKKNKKDTRTPEEIIYDSYKENETQTIEDLIESAQNNSDMDREKCRKVVNRMIEKGHAMKNNNREITLL